MNTRADFIQAKVREGCSRKQVVDLYATEREIWPEEKFIFDTFFKNAGHVLDIGCGGGRTSFYLASLGNKVTAIDISPSLIEAAKERLKREPADIEFFVQDAQHFDYPEDHFDAILFPFNGVGYMVRKEGKLKLLKDIRRILKPEKRFFFTAHNLWCINHDTPLHLRKTLKLFFSKLFHLKIREKEYGEVYDDNEDSPDFETPYFDVKSKQTWDKLTKESGFQIEYFNSKCGIRDKRPFSIFRDSFGKRNYLFFVLKK